MASPKRIDWVAAENDYVTSRMSYADISKKYEVSVRLVNIYGSEHEWVSKRKEYCNKVSAKLADKTADKTVKKLLRLAKAADSIMSVIEKTLADDKQFNRYIVTEKDWEGESTSEQIFEKVDTKALRDVMAVLKDATAVIRNVNEIPTDEEKERRKLLRERFELDKKKQANESNNDNKFEISFAGGYVPEWGVKDNEA